MGVSSAENERAVLSFHREPLVDGIQMTRVALRQGESSLFHHHTRTRDTFYMLKGELVVTLRVASGSPGYSVIAKPRREAAGPEPRMTRVTLGPGDVLSIDPGIVHCATNLGEVPCEFLCLEGVGDYDFIEEAGA
ncbi:MAG TPA: cupin domain-containing protein [Polyangiaceae bacterium]